MKRRRAVHGALLAVVLVAGVILGLLGMHALDAHGAGHVEGADLATLSTALDAGHMSEGSPLVPHDLADGDGAHSGADASAWTACVLALIGGVLALLLRRGVLHLSALRWLLPRMSAVAAQPRGPSLEVLCISRR